MLPKNLKYQNKVESASARAYSSAIQPQGGTNGYVAGNTITINVPTSPNTVLVPSECVLKFELAPITNGATANASVRLDKAGAHGVIQRLRVTHGSQELENLDNYGAIVGEMIALQQSADSSTGKLNVLAGLNPGMFSAGNAESYLSTVGEKLNGYSGNLAAAGTTARRTYCITLMSLVGSLSPQYIPLFEMTSAPLTIQIQLVSSVLRFLASSQALASTNFTIDNVEFIGSFIELSDESISIIRNSLGGAPLQYVIQSYANYTSSSQLGVGATAISHPVPAKFASLRSLFCLMRLHADGATTFFPLSSTHFNILEWRLRIGSQLVPFKAPASMAEHYVELIKAIGSLSDVNHEPPINVYNYSTDVVPTANLETGGTMGVTSKSNCFALGFDLETYANADKDRIFAGMNTLNSDIFWNINFAGLGGTIGAQNVRFDYYALYDNVLVFENGVCYSKR
jgi:hypothetical protein